MEAVKKNLYIIIVAFTLISCSKRDKETIPVVSTSTITEIGIKSAKSGGTIISNGGLDVTSRGICWSTSPNPTTSNQITSDGIGDGSFVSSITGLTSGTLYYVRAYATNELGISYGNSISFTTDAMKLATVVTRDPINITSSTIYFIGEVLADGGAEVYEKGICYGENHNPTITDGKISVGSGLGVFEGTITDLNYATTYYLRSWAQNEAGVAYGNEKEVKTIAIAPVVITENPEEITFNSVKLMGSVINDGGSSITEKGFCFSFLNSDPSFSENNTVVVGGTSDFSITINNLTSETRYYFRAYAINDIDTTLGTTNSFITPAETMVDIENNTYKVVTIGTQKWINENLKTTKLNDGTVIQNVSSNSTWSTYVSPAYCWYNNEIENQTQYGALYNWYVVESSKICPQGWHVPNNTDWDLLISNLGGEVVAGGKLKETGTEHWQSPNTGATNESNFTALPGGDRDNSGPFYYLGTQGYFWSSIDKSIIILYNNQISVAFAGGAGFEPYGISIRCIKDN